MMQQELKILRLEMRHRIIAPILSLLLLAVIAEIGVYIVTIILHEDSLNVKIMEGAIILTQLILIYARKWARPRPKVLEQQNARHITGDEFMAALQHRQCRSVCHKVIVILMVESMITGFLCGCRQLLPALITATMMILLILVVVYLACSAIQNPGNQ